MMVVGALQQEPAGAQGHGKRSDVPVRGVLSVLVGTPEAERSSGEGDVAVPDPVREAGKVGATIVARLTLKMQDEMLAKYLIKGL